MGRGRLYSTLVGDIGGVKTRADQGEVALTVQAEIGGLMTVAAVVTVRFPADAEQPEVSVRLPHATLAEVDYAG